MRIGRAAWCLVVLVATLSTVSASARADDIAMAEALFVEGQRLFDEGKVDEACEKLAASLAIDRAVGTLLNLARCHAAQGKTATAWAEYRSASGLAERKQDTERAVGAAELAAELEPKLSRLTIVAPDAPDGLVVTQGGTELDPGALGTAVPVDPGRHEVTASAPGFEPWSTTIEVAPDGDRKTVTVPALTAAADDGSAPADTTGGGLGTMTMAGLVVAGVGVAALAVGTAFGVITLNEVSDAESDPTLCPNKRCTPDGRAKVDAARTKSNVSTAMLAIGGAALAAGVVMVALDLLDGPDIMDQGALTLDVFAGPTGAMLAAGARF